MRQNRCRFCRDMHMLLSLNRLTLRRLSASAARALSRFCHTQRRPGNGPYRLCEFLNADSCHHSSNSQKGIINSPYLPKWCQAWACKIREGTRAARRRTIHLSFPDCSNIAREGGCRSGRSSWGLIFMPLRACHISRKLEKEGI